MANRYWVGGSGNWNDTAQWSTSSGGGSGASVPTSTDDVFVDSSSGFGIFGGTITLDGAYLSTVCRDFSSTSGLTYTIANGSSDFACYGSMVLEASLTWDSGSNVWLYMVSSTSGKTITSNGCVINFLSFGDQGALGGIADGGAWTLQDNMEVRDKFYCEIGSFNANNYNVTASTFDIQSFYGYTITISMGTGTWEATGNVSTSTLNLFGDVGSPLVINQSTSTIKFTDSSSNIATISIDSSDTTIVLNNIWFSRGASTGDNYFNTNMTCNQFKTTGTLGHSLYFAEGTTLTTTTFVALGSFLSQIIISSFSGGVPSTGTHNLVKNGGGKISCDYLDIQHSVATPANTWYAGVNSTDNQGTATAGSGWKFEVPTNSEMLSLF